MPSPLTVREAGLLHDPQGLAPAVVQPGDDVRPLVGHRHPGRKVAVGRKPLAGESRRTRIRHVENPQPGLEVAQVGGRALDEEVLRRTERPEARDGGRPDGVEHVEHREPGRMAERQDVAVHDVQVRQEVALRL